VVDATGYRPALNVNETGGVFTISEGDLTAVTAEHDYTEILPSANAIIEIAEDKVVRFGVFKALSRPDPADMGFGRTIRVIGDDEDALSLEELITGVGADGNPALDPLMLITRASKVVLKTLLLMKRLVLMAKMLLFL